MSKDHTSTSSNTRNKEDIIEGSGLRIPSPSPNIIDVSGISGTRM